VIEPGRGGAYLALFSEIALVLLVTTLAGVGVGYFVDTRVGSLPLFVVVGFLTGAAMGARAVYVLVTRFLATLDS
jgi:F0F1-type ATP synthase assembly protein I